MADAIVGASCLFKRGDSESNEEFTSISEILTVDGMDLTRDVTDVTSPDALSTYRSFSPGFRDGGEVSLGLNYTRDNWITMKTDFDLDSSVNYQIYMSDTGNTTYDFAAFVTKVGGPKIDKENNAKVTFEITLKVTGEPTVSS